MTRGQTIRHCWAVIRDNGARSPIWHLTRVRQVEVINGKPETINY
ncbi:MAG: hypothetical protein P5694_09420 [Limnospira sp. PMC 1286.21]|nr:hypothetical protein SPLC1_S541260 [Arthrospira platensis C1]MDT9325952.1 hypothetical protein [Limnospira sp. PMC 1286.21]